MSFALLIGSIMEIPYTEDVECPRMVQLIIDVCSLSYFQLSGSHLAKAMTLSPFSNFMCASSIVLVFKLVSESTLKLVAIPMFSLGLHPSFLTWKTTELLPKR